MLRTFCFTVCLLFLLISIQEIKPAHAIPAAVKAKSEIILADELFNNNNFKGAGQHAEKAKKLLGKTNSRIEYMLTKAYYLNGKPVEALQAIETFFEVTPESKSGSDTYIEMVALYAKVEEGARGPLKNAGAYFYRGLAHSDNNNLDSAISDYTKVIELDPKDSNSYFNRGLDYSRKNDLDAAMSDYTKAIELDNDNEYILLSHFIASSKLSSSALDTSMKQLKRFIQKNKSSAWIRTVSLYYSGQEGLSETDVLSRARQGKTQKEVDEQLCEAYYYLAENRFQNGDKKGALDFFKKSFATNVFNFREYSL